MTGEERDSEQSEIENELLGRLAAGENVDVEHLCRQHPQYAGELRKLYRARRFLDRREGAGQEESPQDLDGLLSGYEVVRLLGRGGMGRVYLARQRSLRGRLVAIKVMNPAYSDNNTHRERFRREAELAARLSHKGIAKVYESGEAGGVLYYVMEYISGRPLDEVLRDIRARCGLGEGRPPPDADGETTVLHRALRAGPDGHRSEKFVRAAAGIVMEAAEAVGHAHRADPSQVHRDLKPGNIMLRLNEETGTCSQPVVLDFGLARPATGSGLTAPDELLGTREFVSPEQHDDPTRATTRSDVFSLGAVLHDLLSLADPAARPPARQGLAAIRALNPTVDRSLSAIVSRATDPDPRFRYADARDLADDLARFLANLPVHARAYSVFGRARTWVRRHPAWATIALLAGVLLLIAGYFGLAIGARALAQARDVPRILDLDAAGRFVAARDAIEHWAGVAETWPLIGLRPELAALRESYQQEPRATVLRLLGPFGDGGDVLLDGKSRRTLLRALVPAADPPHLLLGQGNQYLRLLADLLRRGDADLVKDLAEQVTTSLGQCEAEHHVGNTHASGLLPRMLWGELDGYQQLAAAAVDWLAATDLDGAVAAEQDVLALLSYLPTRDAFGAARRRLRAHNQETVRRSLVTLGRIALYWSGPDRDEAARLADAVVDLELVRSALFDVLDESLLRHQASHPDCTLHEVLRTFILALTSVPGPAAADWRRGEALRQLLLERLPPNDSENLRYRLLAMAGARELPPEAGLGTTSPARTVEGRSVTVARLLIDVGDADALTAIEALYRDPLAEQIGQYRLGPLQEEAEIDLDALRRLIGRLVVEALEEYSGFRDLPVGRGAACRLLSTIVQNTCENGEVRNAEQWCERIGLAMRCWERFGGPDGVARMRQEGQWALARVGDDSAPFGVRYQSALILVYVASHMPDQVDSFLKAIGRLGDAVPDDEDRRARVANLRFLRARLLALSGEDGAALAELAEMARAGSIGPLTAFQYQDEPEVAALLLHADVKGAIQAAESARHAAPAASELAAEPTNPPLAESEPALWAGEHRHEYHAEWDFSRDERVDSGWARGEPVVFEYGTGEDSYGHHLILLRPGTSRLRVYAEVPGRPCTKDSNKPCPAHAGVDPTCRECVDRSADLDLHLLHLAASSPGYAFAGSAAMSIWINGARVGDITVVNHEFDYTRIPVACWLQAGINTIEIRVEAGPSHYWLRNLRLEGTIQAAPQLRAP